MIPRVHIKSIQWCPKNDLISLVVFQKFINEYDLITNLIKIDELCQKYDKFDKG